MEPSWYCWDDLMIVRDGLGQKNSLFEYSIAFPHVLIRSICSALLVRGPRFDWVCSFLVVVSPHNCVLPSNTNLR